MVRELLCCYVAVNPSTLFLSESMRDKSGQDAAGSGYARAHIQWFTGTHLISRFIGGTVRAACIKQSCIKASSLTVTTVVHHVRYGTTRRPACRVVRVPLPCTHNIQLHYDASKRHANSVNCYLHQCTLRISDRHGMRHVIGWVDFRATHIGSQPLKLQLGTTD